MNTYFNDCHNLEDLRKKYIQLMKKYHPDSVTNKNEVEKNNQICQEINFEYEALSKILPQKNANKPDSKSFENVKCYYSTQEQIINGSQSAEKAMLKITNYINNHDIYKDIARNKEFYDSIYKDISINKKFYNDHRDEPWYIKQLQQAIKDTIYIFWNTCLYKKIIGDEFGKLFEICNYDTEKMKRTIMFLNTGAISEADIHTNLTMDNPIPFFDDNIPLENLPSYDSFFILNKHITLLKTREAWIEFCQKQRDNFHEKFYDIIYQKISNETHK